MKKLLSLTLVLVMVLSLGFNALAADVKSADADYQILASDLENYINNCMRSRAPSQLDKVVEAFVMSYKDKYDAVTLVDNLENEIIVYQNGDEFVAINGFEIIVFGCTEGSPTISPTSAAASTTTYKEYYHAVYALLLGQELYRIVQGAQFSYDGTNTPTVTTSDGYYQRGFLSIWQVSDFNKNQESTLTTGGVTYRKVMASGNFHYGLEIQGVGLVIQDFYCWVDIRCDKNGNVSGYCDNNHNV